MRLGELIKVLESVDPEMVIPFGFRHHHSYRGYYADLEFSPAANVPVRDMLAEARGCLGTTIEGYKGGEYKVSEWTTVWLGHWGECVGQTIGPYLIRYMLGLPVTTEEA